MIEPVVKEVWVPVPVESAFRRFTDEMAQWWPLGTHSVSEADCVDARFEDGRIVEEARDGTIHEWGRVQTWEPPSRVAFTWYPGRGPDTAGLVEVTFTPRDGGTQVRLVHSGWERLGDKAVELRTGYDSGWEGVLGLYEAAAAA